MQAEGSGSQGSGCLFSGGSLPAPHAGLHTAPHTPLRTALRRLAHAANQRARRGRPIRASRREDGAARGRDGAARGCFRPRPSVFPAAPRARGPCSPAFRSPCPPGAFWLIPRPAGPGGGVASLCVPASAVCPISSRGGTPGDGSVMSVGPGQTPSPPWAPERVSALRPLRWPRPPRRAPVRGPSVWAGAVCPVTRGWGCGPQPRGVS